MDRPDLQPLALSVSGEVFEKSFPRELPERIRHRFSRGVRRLRVLSISQRRFLAAALSSGSAQLPVRLQSAGTDYMQGLPGAAAIWRTGRFRESIVSGRTHVSRLLRAPALALPRAD